MEVAAVELARALHSFVGSLARWPVSHSIHTAHATVALYFLSSFRATRPWGEC